MSDHEDRKFKHALMLLIVVCLAIGFIDGYIVGSHCADQHKEQK